MPARFANHPILTWLLKHNLHLAIARFRRNVTIPLVMILIARVIAAVIQTQLVQSRGLAHTGSHALPPTALMFYALSKILPL